MGDIVVVAFYVPSSHLSSPFLPLQAILSEDKALLLKFSTPISISSSTSATSTSTLPYRERTDPGVEVGVSISAVRRGVFLRKSKGSEWG